MPYLLQYFTFSHYVSSTPLLCHKGTSICASSSSSSSRLLLRYLFLLTGKSRFPTRSRSSIGPRGIHFRSNLFLSTPREYLLQHVFLLRGTAALFSRPWYSCLRGPASLNRGGATQHQPSHRLVCFSISTIEKHT